MNRYGLDDGCPTLPFLDQPGVCNRCGTRLTGRRTQWCSSACESVLRENHDWNLARRAARKRDGNKCVRCGHTGIPRVFVGHVDAPPEIRTPAWSSRNSREWGLEVNHMTPREGRGYGWGCAHHLDGLETLCKPCHRDETNNQAAERRSRQQREAG